MATGSQGTLPDPADQLPVQRDEVTGVENADSVVEAVSVYARSERTGALRQSEIICNLLQFTVDPQSLKAGGELAFGQLQREFAVVLSQDCDLAQDFELRRRTWNEELLYAEIESKLLPNVLLCELVTDADLFAALPQGSDIRKRVKQNKDERYQYLCAVPTNSDTAGTGLPALGIDFKRHFTIPTEELYLQISQAAVRRCRLVSPYLEHLATRFSSFLSRVALPSNHHDL
jgi:hypothetical protein